MVKFSAWFVIFPRTSELQHSPADYTMPQTSCQTMNTVNVHYHFSGPL